MKSRPAFAFSLLFLAACGGGSTTPATVSYEGAVTSTDTARGEVVWNEKCAGCHTEQAGAYGPPVYGQPHTAADMRRQIREGSGRMPGIGDGQLPAADLEALLAHLAAHGAVTP